MVFLKSSQYLLALCAMIGAVPLAPRTSPAQSLAELAREERAKKAESKEPAVKPDHVYTNDNFADASPNERSTSSKEATEAIEKTRQLYQKLARARDLLAVEQEKLWQVESQHSDLRVRWLRVRYSADVNDYKLAMSLIDEMYKLSPAIERQRAVVEVARRSADDLERDLRKETASALGNQNNDLRNTSSTIESMTASQLARHYLAELDSVNFPERQDWEQRLWIKKEAFVRASQEAVNALTAYENSGPKTLVSPLTGVGVTGRYQELIAAANRASEKEKRTWIELQAIVNEGRRRGALWKDR